MTHASPPKVLSALTATGLDSAGLAAASGLAARILDEGLAGSRRLGVAAMQAIGGAVGGEWWDLRCDHATGREKACAGCNASNLLTTDDLGDVIRTLGDLLAEARARDTPVSEWSALPTFATAREALVAVGSELTAEQLESVGLYGPVGPSAKPDELRLVAEALAIVFAAGDVETEELVGLDVDLDVPSGVRVAGWDLIRYDAADVARFDVFAPAGLRTKWTWDRISAEGTWWLRRDAGTRPPVEGPVITIEEPSRVALAPLVALALLDDEPPHPISHAWAQRGHGVRFSIGSHELDYVVEGNGYPNIFYGSYRVRSGRAARWQSNVAHLGGLIEKVFADNSRQAKRYRVAATEFLRVANDLYEGWDLIRRLPLDMSTVMETLLLDGSSKEGEFRRRVSISAGWLGGTDDTDRTNIRSFARAVYDAGSAYRHGGEGYTLRRGAIDDAPKSHLDVVRAYRLLRRLIVHGLAVAAAGESVAQLCDDVQSTAAARIKLEEIIAQFYSAIGVAPAPFPPG